MASIREQLATKCKIKDLEFWVRSVSATFQRSLAGHGGIGIEGERFEDLGEGARRHQIAAELYEDEWLKLKAIYTEGKRVSFTHPLFGVYQVRIESIGVNADHREMVDATITLVEDGEREIELAPVVHNLGAVKFSWDSAFDDINAATSALSSEGIDSGAIFTDSIGDNFTLEFTNFGAVLDLALAAEAAVDEVAAAYSDFAEAANAAIAELEDLGGLYAEFNDAIQASVAIAQDAVRSISVLDSAPWNNFLTKAPVLIGSIAAEFLGADNDDNIDTILQYNPGLIDVGIIPAGFELVIPVL